MKVKRLFTSLISYILIISVLVPSAFAAGAGTGAAVYSHTAELLDGFTYTNETSFNSDGSRVEAFKLVNDVGSEVYPIVITGGDIYAGMTADEVVKYVEGLGKTVVGVVNSDFYATSSKVPLGIVIEDGIYKSSPVDENILAFSDSGAFVLDGADIAITLHNDSEGENGGKETTVRTFNKLRNDFGGLYLLSEDFSDTAKTTTPGWAVRMKINEGEMRLGSVLKLTVEEILTNAADINIGEGYIVLTAANECGMGAEREKFSVGDGVTMTVGFGDERLLEAKWATGCGDIIIRDGAMTDYNGWDSALFGFNPRTVLGIFADGSVAAYVVDGRASGYSAGARMTQTASDLIDMGCRFAVNLDGGGSTVAAVKAPGTEKAEVVSSPSDGYQRRNGVYIAFVTDRTRGEGAGRLYLREDGAYVMAGSTVSINAFAADGALFASELEGNVSFSSDRVNIIDGQAYFTAGREAADEYITFTAGSLHGEATLHVITAVDSFSVTDDFAGRQPMLLDLEQGANVGLIVSLQKYGRGVYVDNNSVDYYITPSVGEISEDGMITVTGLPGARGEVMVFVGALSQSFEITVASSFDDTARHWAAEFIEALYREGIIRGVAERLFDPDNVITRGDFVLMMWRALGRPAAKGELSFTDVPEGYYYADAIAWAETTGVTHGVGDGRFDPEATLSRQQAITLVFRAIFNERVLSEDDVDVLAQFRDISKMDDYAVTAAAELIVRGVLQGSDDGRLRPADNITRAEIAKILCLAFFYKFK